MGDNKRYIGVRLYISTSDSETTKSGETGVDVQPHEVALGSNSISIKSQREQYKDSRLAVLRGGGGYYIYILSKLAALSIGSALITAFSEDWKGHTVAAMILVIGSAFIVRVPVANWFKRYWR